MISPPPHPPEKRAFTLVELSVVLVIIGLLVAGVLAAQDMIRAAQIRGVVKDVNRYQSVVNLFKDKYGHLPGDMPNATDFWSACTDSGSNTCNGDGDHSIEWTAAGEGVRMWQHLHLSGLLSESYTGLYTSSIQADIGTNVPATGMDGVGWFITGSTWLGNLSSSQDFLQLGMRRTTTLNNASAITPVEAWEIDNKMDDGMPYTGKVFGLGGWNGSGHSASCVSGTGSSAIYRKNVETIECIMGFDIY